MFTIVGGLLVKAKDQKLNAVRNRKTVNKKLVLFVNRTNSLPNIFRRNMAE